ncbi:hypothetical protein C7440_3765 [Pusillimonas noertemannii]|uniref:Uncharacterized protein n=1 Tax=Pusillimonas noertemannii TaxID=305977 RepID=A0A2U1CHC8_9BURK|nr:hypothetical protein C7440_3765 [Pusillimonas noertemannii]
MRFEIGRLSFGLLNRRAAGAVLGAPESFGRLCRLPSHPIIFGAPAKLARCTAPRAVHTRRARTVAGLPPQKRQGARLAQRRPQYCPRITPHSVLVCGVPRKRCGYSLQCSSCDAGCVWAGRWLSSQAPQNGGRRPGGCGQAGPKGRLPPPGTDIPRSAGTGLKPTPSRTKHRYGARKQTPYRPSAGSGLETAPFQQNSGTA